MYFKKDPYKYTSLPLVDRFEGEWKDGGINGIGTFYFKNGNISKQGFLLGYGDPPLCIN
jgi:hypothetical protein